MRISPLELLSLLVVGGFLFLHGPFPITGYQTYDCGFCNVSDLSCPGTANVSEGFDVSYQYYGTGTSESYEVRTVSRNSTQVNCTYEENSTPCTWHSETVRLVCPDTPGIYSFNLSCYAASSADSGNCGSADDYQSCVVECVEPPVPIPSVSISDVTTVDSSVNLSYTLTNPDQFSSLRIYRNQTLEWSNSSGLSEQGSYSKSLSDGVYDLVLSGEWNQTTLNDSLVYTKDTQPPEISSVNVTVYTSFSIVRWTTDEKSDSRVWYGRSKDDLSLDRDSDDVLGHAVKLSGLMEGETYYFYVESRDSKGNRAIDNRSGNFYQFDVEEEEPEPPQFSSHREPSSVDMGDSVTVSVLVEDEDGVDEVVIDMDGEHEMTKDGNTYSYTFTPEYSGTYSYLIRATDSNGQENTISGRFTVVSPTTTTEPQGQGADFPTGAVALAGVFVVLALVAWKYKARITRESKKLPPSEKKGKKPKKPEVNVQALLTELRKGEREEEKESQRSRRQRILSRPVEKERSALERELDKARTPENLKDRIVDISRIDSSKVRKKAVLKVIPKFIKSFDHHERGYYLSDKSGKIFALSATEIKEEPMIVFAKVREIKGKIYLRIIDTKEI